MANRNPNRKGLMPAWKPGQRGNPSGRPRREPVSGRYEFLCEVPLPENIRKKLCLEAAGATYGDALSRMQFRAALNGNTGTARETREAIEGKAAFHTEEERESPQFDLSAIPTRHVPVDVSMDGACATRCSIPTARQRSTIAKT